MWENEKGKISPSKLYILIYNVEIHIFREQTFLLGKMNQTAELKSTRLNTIWEVYPNKLS